MQSNTQIAAVLILVYPVDQEPHVVFTRRSETVGQNRGQISLPGGRRDDADVSLAGTALREAEEELGFPATDVRLLGHLPDVYVIVSNFMITPYVGTLAYRPHFVPNPAEVAEVIEVPLRVLCSPHAFHKETWSWRGSPRLVQFYAHGPHQIWGATGRVIQEFLDNHYVELASGELGLVI